LIDQLHLTKHQKKRSFKRRKRILFFSKSYQRLLLLLKKPWLKWSFVLILVFGFGIPLHLFPKEIEHPNDLGEIYNATLGSNWFQNQRSTLEPIVGGTFRLFTQDVFENSYYAEPEETSINITGRMPEGCTVQQLNDAITKMEAYLSTFDEISLFETQITSYRNGQINVYFKDDLPSESFPFTLKNQIETKALSLGGLDWFVTGVGEGFSNAVGSSGLGERIILEGYNYDQLYAFAEELKASIFENSKNRVEKAQISGEKWGSSALAEFYLEFNPELVELSKLKTTKIYNQLKNRLHSENATAVVQNNELQEVKIVSDTYLNFNIWDLKNTPIQIDSSQYKLSELAFIEKRKTGNTIRKTNQKYSLTLAYNFKGPDRMADRFNKLWSSQFHEQLSIGYRAYSPNQKDRWDREDKTQYYYLFLIIGIIFFVCSILLDSLRQPIAIILMIPISFVGVFLTFYAFEINFDQGGYASFILLAGISVNSALYILNDFNNLKKDRPNLSLSTQYQKAFLSKITPVLITILTTIFGLIPFIWDGQQEVFWFSFAAGSIGGLVFSLIGIFLYLPLFMKLQMRRIH
jgi:multidrug efflux pump subunit AcrB